MLNGLLDLPLWGLVVATLILSHSTIVSVTVFLHRAQAHRALELHPALSHVFRFWLWLTTGMVTREWVAVHRKHHARCETEEDPHSPQVLGIGKLLGRGAELYKAAARDADMVDRYGQGTPDDWLERKLYGRHPNYGPTLLFFINFALFGVPGISVWAIQMLWIPFWAAGVINGIGHYWGYRNYETPDASANICPWGIFIGGEELHNNHHAFPTSARLSSKWWEFDLGWLYIRVMEGLRLVRVKRVAPVPSRVPGKQTVDLDTVRAVLRGHFHVMADFAHSVVKPVLREELQKADGSCRRFLKRQKQLLLRADARLSAPDQDRLQRLLQTNQTLCTIYEYRLRLQKLWERTSAGHDKLVVSLQEWCAQAEASGIQALQDFARSLRAYSLRSV